MSLLEYFREQYGVKQIGEITWSHAVNDQRRLEQALAGPAMFIESDIRLSIKTGMPVAAHPPDTESDLDYQSLLQNMKESRQGLKLDFKDPEILEHCLVALKDSDLQQPVLLNADILQGNGAGISKFNPSEFIRLCERHYPRGILSIGWTTTADPANAYTRDNVDAMLALVANIDEVTFPIRASLLPNSWTELQRLLDHEGRTLSIWGLGTQEIIQWIETNTDPTKTFYDLVNEQGESISSPSHTERTSKR